MEGSDMVMCKYIFSNNTNTDAFVCEDRWGQDNEAPTLDQIRNTVDVSTNVLYEYR